MALKGSRIAAYARYSSDKQSDASIEDQLRRIRELVAREGHSLDEALIFTDYAISGSSTNRPGFDALMGKIHRRELDVLLVESVDRLSRDLGDSDRLYKDLRANGVQLLSLGDGIDSSNKGAKLQFGVKALFADMYLDDLRDKTVRGMKGRAHAGLSTGGLPYGYKSTPLPGPDPRTPAGFKISIDEEKAPTLRRIFSLYANGESLAGIATALNRDGVPSPRDKTQHIRKPGWGASTIRAMLYNDRYQGVWSFNEREWVKAPGTNRRVPRRKEASEVVRQSRPELRIIDEDTWTRSRERLARAKAMYAGAGPKAGRAGGTANQHVLSGLLRCACGAPMIVQQGSSAGYYVCADSRHGRCANTKRLRESLAVERVIEALRTRLGSSEGIAYARKRIAERLGELGKTRGAEISELRQRLTRTEKRIGNIVAAISEGERSQSLSEALRDLDAQAKTDRDAIANLESAASQPIRLPTPDVVMARVEDTLAMMKQNPAAARERLRAILKDAAIRLEISSEGHYIGRAEVFPLMLMAETKHAEPLLKDSAWFGNGSGGALRMWNHALSQVIEVGFAPLPVETLSHRPDRDKRN